MEVRDQWGRGEGGNKGREKGEKNRKIENENYKSVFFLLI